MKSMSAVKGLKRYKLI